ncbi:pentatricopeptide repeat-containing protein At3g63370, chloroplastic [Nymphaea colorata]|nr:pentatricopeptide repeat-containing protein At3g63370, chloroplastic [Nymphaea colorata]
MQGNLSLPHRSMATILNLRAGVSSAVHHPNVMMPMHSQPLGRSSLSPRPLRVPPLVSSSPSDVVRLCKEGRFEESFEAFDLFLRKNGSFSHLGVDVLSCLLELCASRGALFQGKQLHGRIVSLHGNVMDSFLGTKLVFMYSKCGCLEDAQHLFDEMPDRTVFTWNALIGGLVTYGQSVAALRLYGRMCQYGVLPDACTFACALKACGELNDVNCGRVVHGQAVKEGFGSSVFVLNALVSMYAKCDELDLACTVFDGISAERDVVSWNSIISANSQSGNSIEALRLFRVMQSDGVSMNSFTIVGILQACADLSLVRLGMEIHAKLVRLGLESSLYESNSLLVMYARCGKMGLASLVFRKMNSRDDISWNSMLSGYVQNFMYCEALDFFREMLQNGQSPDNVSIISVLSACGRLGNLFHGMEAHAYAIKFGFGLDNPVGNTIVDMYTKCSRMDYADLVFYRMPEKDIISWTTIMAGYAQNFCCLATIKLFREVQMLGVTVDPLMLGSILLASSGLDKIHYVKQIHGYIFRHNLFDLVLANALLDTYGQMRNLKYALDVFKSIAEKDVVSWTSIISSYVHNGLPNEAFNLFHEMGEDGHEPDAVALISILSAAAALSTMNRGKEIHGYLLRRGFTIEGATGNALVDMYSRCGTVDNAYKLFERIHDKDLVLWSSMISAFGMHGRGNAAILMFTRMQKSNVQPDRIAFLAILYACSHSGLVQEGKAYFESMLSDHHLAPWPEHYACMVDLLGRNNYLNEAYNFIKDMAVEPTAAVWCALLGACRVYGSTEIGSLAAQKLLELEPEKPGNYVLVSNFYAAAGKGKDVEKVREKMRQRGLKKDPACTWIEVRNKMHSFIAGDKSHPQSEEIYAMLAEIKVKLEKAGFMSQTKLVLHDVGEEKKVNMLYSHSERLAISFGLISTNPLSPIRITKNLRVCADCHEFTKFVSRVLEREIIVRDANRFHHYCNGVCSCGDFW